MNQKEFIESFMEFDKLFVKEGLDKTDLIISLFKIWYENENQSQKWINVRNFSKDD